MYRIVLFWPGQDYFFQKVPWLRLRSYFIPPPIIAGSREKGLSSGEKGFSSCQENEVEGAIGCDWGFSA